jgi:hypothetical protein
MSQYLVLGFSSQCYTKQLVPLAAINLYLASPFITSIVGPILKMMLEEEFVNSPNNVSIITSILLLLYLTKTPVDHNFDWHEGQKRSAQNNL